MTSAESPGRSRYSDESYSALYIMHAGGTNQIMLTDNAGKEMNPVWSPAL